MKMAQKTTLLIDEIIANSQLLMFKKDFADAVTAIKNTGEVSDDLKQCIRKSFRMTIAYINHMVYQSTRLSEEERVAVGEWARQEFLPYSLLGSWSSRSFIKPQRIAGDHYTIQQIYSNGSNERRGIGAIINMCFFNEPACKAVENRKNYIAAVILEKISTRSDKTLPLQIASIASGPSEEIFDVYTALGDANKKHLNVLGIDKDKRACASVDDIINTKKLGHLFSTASYDVLMLGKYPHLAQSQDLVYSMGLLDYFKDKLVVKILNRMYDMLKPGGEIIVGNFHTQCDSRLFLDYLLDWPLIYRTEGDFRRLFAESQFGRSEVTIHFEDEQVNMLIHCTKNTVTSDATVTLEEADIAT